VNVRIPFDSVAVIGCGDSWSEAFAEAIARMMTPSRCVRIVPPQRVREYSGGEMVPEEIGREVNARCVAVCRVTASESTIDVSLEAIDVLAERVAAHESFLTSAAEIFVAQERSAAWLAHVLCGDCARISHRHETATPRAYVAVLRAREATSRDALAILREHDDGSPFLMRELARVIVETPDDLLDALTIDQARRAIAATLRVDLRCAEAHSIAAAIKARFDGDWTAADAHLATARELAAPFQNEVDAFARKLSERFTPNLPTTQSSTTGGV
jgi:hypothetical protein